MHHIWEPNGNPCGSQAPNNPLLNARDVPIIIDEIMVSLDIYIFPIIGFGLLIGYPLEEIVHHKSSQGSLSDELGKRVAAIPISIPET